MVVIRTDRTTHTAPARITIRASVSGVPMGPHQRYWGNTCTGPITSSVATRPTFEGLNMWLLPTRMKYFEASDRTTARMKYWMP